MFKLGKLLFGLAVAGVTAATVYNYLDESNGSEEDFENDLPEDQAEEEEDRTERLKVAAERTYTTIKAGSADAMAKVREAIGPKGEEVLDVMGETAGNIRNVVVDSAVRVKDILAEEETGIDEGVIEEAVANAVAEEMEAEAAEKAEEEPAAEEEPSAEAEPAAEEAAAEEEEKAAEE